MLLYVLITFFSLFRFIGVTALESNVQAVLGEYEPPLWDNNHLEITAKCNCSGTNNTHNKKYVCGDPRLGPIKLPRKFPLVAVLNGYDRFGGMQPGEFLEKFTDENGRWVYPPKGGYLLDNNGKPIFGNTTLRVGIKLDRFGSEYGSYVAEAEGPYDQRALPPSNLATDPAAPDYPLNYHGKSLNPLDIVLSSDIYPFSKPFEVEAGPVASWFGQPGLGAQFYTGYTGNILKLLELGYIERVNKTEQRGPGKQKGACS